MKALTKYQIMAILLPLLILSSCAKEYPFHSADSDGLELQTGYDEVAVRGGELLVAVIERTMESLNPKMIEEKDSYPLIGKLISLDIIDGDGNQTSFFNLQAEERAAFLEELSRSRAEALTEKFNQAPGLRDYIDRQNGIVSLLLAETPHATKAGGEDPFLRELARRTDELATSWTDFTPMTKNSGAVNNSTVVMDFTSNQLLDFVKDFSYRTSLGDILLTLPNPNNPKALINFGSNNNNCIFGHAEIITLNHNLGDFFAEFKDSDIEYYRGEMYYRPYTEAAIYKTVYNKSTRKVELHSEFYYGASQILRLMDQIKNGSLNNFYINSEYRKDSKGWRDPIENIIKNKNMLLAQGRYTEKEIIDEFDGKIIECYVAQIKIDSNYMLDSDAYMSENYRYENPFYTEIQNEETLEINSKKIYHHTYARTNQALKKYLYDNHLTGCISNDLGVQNTIYKYWFDNQYEWYLLGIRKIRSVYNKTKRKYETQWVDASETEMQKFVNVIKNQMGKKYVSQVEFPFAKWCAPNKYTCTSIIWYALKQSMDIDISPWYSTVVSPSDVYGSNNTYTKKKIVSDLSWYESL